MRYYTLDIYSSINPFQKSIRSHVVCFDLFHTSDYIFDQNELLNPLVIKNAICIIYLQKYDL